MARRVFSAAAAVPPAFLLLELLISTAHLNNVPASTTTYLFHFLMSLGDHVPIAEGCVQPVTCFCVAVLPV